MRKILKSLLKDEINIKKAESLLKANNIKELDEIANFDSSREYRTGFPEAVLAKGKTYDDLITIIKRYFKVNNYSKRLSFNKNYNNKYFDNKENTLLITKLEKNKYSKLREDLDYLHKNGIDLEYNSKAKILIIKTKNNKKTKEIKSFNNKIGIITAGTSDITIAEEAKVVAEQGGCEVITSFDVGVAGIHRLFPQLSKMVKEEVKVIIVCAGMDGALPSIITGLVDIPVIGVPTSVGYGIAGKGKAALYSMLQSCAPGIAVVNIDNGFGAAVLALKIINTASKNSN